MIILMLMWSSHVSRTALKPLTHNRRPQRLTAISLQADIEIPVPSICFSAYSFSSFLQRETERSCQIHRDFYTQTRTHTRAHTHIFFVKLFIIISCFHPKVSDIKREGACVCVHKKKTVLYLILKSIGDNTNQLNTSRYEFGQISRANQIVNSYQIISKGK